jgi:hypothetical protein
LGTGVRIFTFATAKGVSGNLQRLSTSRTDAQDYYGRTSTFTITDVNTGRVDFARVAGGGGKAFFSLEERPDVSLAVTVGGVPEPAPYALFGTGLLAVMLYRRRRLATERAYPAPNRVQLLYQLKWRH